MELHGSKERMEEPQDVILSLRHQMSPQTMYSALGHSPPGVSCTIHSPSGGFFGAGGGGGGGGYMGEGQGGPGHHPGAAFSPAAMSVNVSMTLASPYRENHINHQLTLGGSGGGLYCSPLHPSQQAQLQPYAEFLNGDSSSSSAGAEACGFAEDKRKGTGEDRLSPSDQGTGSNVCRICGKSYARPSTLKTHLRTHSGERPFRCGQCNKSFSQAANLTAHVRTHSGEKPFRCGICDRRFSQSSSVTTHLRTHSGDRPYRCRLCRKAFADSSTLTKHLRIHSGEKPYQCHLCLLRFSQSGNLNRHMRVHAANGS
ncbi:unnamed protein product [Darwinula stevensoni]|uniref:Protein glass n=1 Tax=Darwinula stevensoni TaxID=69355 RepID=A0A7R9AI41_9CRUS|nr:unnamed protein product [Darwinula stevensoni]CAG0906238.1 unnamed protein product [Darwinula stevensoni]